MRTAKILVLLMLGFMALSYAKDANIEEAVTAIKAESDFKDLLQLIALAEKRFGLDVYAYNTNNNEEEILYDNETYRYNVRFFGIYRTTKDTIKAVFLSNSHPPEVVKTIEIATPKGLPHQPMIVSPSGIRR